MPPDRGQDRRLDTLCLGVLTGLTALFFWRCLFTDAVLLPTDVVLRLQPWRQYSHSLFPDWKRIYNPLLDVILLYYPWRVLAARAIAAGQIPLWNPDSFCGQPFLANVSSAVLYPPNLLFYVMSPARAYGYVSALHTFLAGMGTYLFLRLLNVRPAAALLGGITFMFCGFLVVWTEYQAAVAATTWLPLALTFWERYAQGHGRRFAVYASGPLALSLLAGHLQYAVYVLLVFTAYAAWRKGLRLSVWAVASGVVVLAMALAAHQILPSLELGRYNHRSGGTPLQEVLRSALPLRHLITFLVPNFFGNSVDYNYWGHFNFVEMCGYLGIAPLILALLAPWIRRDGHTRFFAVVALILLLMILGTPLYAPLYYLVPGFKQLNNPGRMLGVFSLVVACLAALGTDRLAQWPVERRRVLFGALLGLLLAACAAVSAAYSASAETIAEIGLQGYVALQVGVFLVFALASVSVLAATTLHAGAIWLVPLLTAGDLFLFGMRFNPAGDPRMLFFPTASLEILRAQRGPFRVMAAMSPNQDFLNTMMPNCNLAVGLAEVQGGDAMYPRRYREFVEFVESLQQRRPVRVGNGLAFSSVDTPGLDFLGPRYVLSAYELRSPRLELLAKPDIHLYHNRAARPRAFLVHRARVESPQRVLKAMAEEGFALDQVAVVEEEPVLPLAPGRGKEEAEITHHAFCRVRVEVVASANALLILADQYFPGWRVTVDGKPAVLQAANYVLRAVAVPRGRHTVEFTYRPTSFLVGLYLTLGAFAVVVGTLAATLASRRHRAFAGGFPRA